MRKWILEKKWRVIISGIFIMAVPVISLAFFVYFKVTSELEQRVTEESRMYAELIAHEIEERLNSDIAFGSAYALRPYLIAGLQRGDKKELDMHLKNLVENSHTIDRAFIASHEGVELSAYPEDPAAIGKDFSDMDWYKGVSKKWTPYVSEFYIRMAESKGYLFSIAIPIKAKDNSIVGILIMQPADNYIKDAVSKMRGGIGFVYVVDKKGFLIYHPEYKLDRLVDFSHIPAVRKVKAGITGVERMIEHETGEKTLLAYYPVKEWGLGVVVQTPLKDVLAPVREITLGLLAFTGFMLLMGGFFAYRAAEMFISTQRLTKEIIEEREAEKIYNEILTLLNMEWNDAEGMCDASLKKISIYICAESGILYAFENERLIPYAALSVQKPSVVDGLPLECLKQKRTIRINDISQDTYLKIETGIGVMLPKDIITVPLFYKDAPMGVLELACIHGFRERDVKVIEWIAPQLAIGINTIKSQMAIKKLSEENSRSNEELKAMNEELQTMNEELQSQQKELFDANRRLDEASRAKSDFLANMSHELRTPLNSIIGFSEVLEDELYGELNEKQIEYVRDINNSGRHLLDLINDILDLSKVEAGKMELELSSFFVKEILGASISLFKENALKRNLSLSLDIMPDADVEIEADMRKLKQIMFNLMSNAVKFTPDGGSVRVTAQMTRDEGRGTRVEVSVEDTGIGMKAEDISKLFKEFTQLESPYTKLYEGTGLGLALTKKLVELHGGSIRVDSKAGEGSKFIFTIPLRQPEKPKPLSLNRLLPQSDRKERFVLTIDDDPKTLSIIDEALSGGGYKVFNVSNGEDGVMAAIREIPDLIILDLMMPDMNGFEVINKLRADDRTASIPIVVITAMSLSNEDKERLKGRVQYIAEKGRLARENFINEIRKIEI
jgi:signal transduction histidine kinase/CheY-like chemotaxis protein